MCKGFWMLLAGGLVMMAGCREVAESERLLAQIRSLAQGVCVRDDECGVLPLGHKPCGGPAFFLPYSVRDDRTRLMELAERHRRLSAEASVPDGVSDCRLEAPPPVGCRSGRCRLTPSP